MREKKLEYDVIFPVVHRVSVVENDKMRNSGMLCREVFTDDGLPFALSQMETNTHDGALNLHGCSLH